MKRQYLYLWEQQGKIKNHKQGAILITTLWIMAILSMLAVSIAFRSGMEMRLTKYNIEQLSARYLAKAGIVKAKNILLKDYTIREYDTLYECGVSLGINDNDEDVTHEMLFGEKVNEIAGGFFSIGYDEAGHFYYGMSDEERKININMAKLTNNDRAEFKRILSGLSPDLTEQDINAMVDWQDSDSMVSYPGGAEDFDYEAEMGYSCKDSDFETVEEVLLIKGMKGEVFDQIKDDITVYGEGKVNINTASKRAINAVINDESGFYTSLVDNIDVFRKADDGEYGSADDRYFISIADVKSIARTDFEEQRIDALSRYFIFKSENFRVVSKGSKGRAGKTITCVLRVYPNSPSAELKYYHEN